MTSPSKIGLIAFTAIILAIIGVLFVLHYKTGPVYQELQNLNLIPKPERFTELYFENPSTLPDQAQKDQPISFAFTIHNVEGTSTVYPYIVYFHDAEESTTIFARDTVSLSADASTTIAISHTFTTANESGTVIVDLPSLNQQIDFLLSVND